MGFFLGSVFLMFFCVSKYGIVMFGNGLKLSLGLFYGGVNVF